MRSSRARDEPTSVTMVRGVRRRAVAVAASAALLLPCNIVLEPSDDGGTHISAVDPRDLMPEPAFKELAENAACKLTAALEAVHTWAESS